MKYSKLIPLSLIVTVIAICFFCSDISAPMDSKSTTLTPDVTLFTKDNYQVVEESGRKDVGVALEQPNQISSITISSSCGGDDTVLSVQSSNPFDTIYFTRSFVHAGPCTLIARAETYDTKLSTKITFLPLYVSVSQQIITDDQSDTKNEPTTKTENDPIIIEESTTPLTPRDFYAPENIIAGNADTLQFTADAAKGQTVLLTSTDLDPTVFTIIDSGPDIVRIAVMPEAPAGGSAQIGIAVSNGTRTDTTVYPVTLKDAGGFLWNCTELPVEAIEGAEVQFDLKPYLINTEAIITSDIGMISEGNIWTFIPLWGSEEEIIAKITAKTAENSSVLTLNVMVPSGDATQPVISKPVQGEVIRFSEKQITLKCNAADSESGIADVSMTYGDQIVKAVAQDDETFSGVISGLISMVPVEVTITVTDNSRAKNQSQVTISVLYDSTMTDEAPPVIELLSDIVNDQRLTAAEGTLSYTVTDGSGVDSVWWTLNGTFGGVLPLLEDGTYSLNYALTKYGINSIAVIAQDGTVNHNLDSLIISVMYNVVPVAPVIETPETGGIGIGTEPTLTWTGGDDPDGDSVFYQVRYNKSTETIPVTTPEISEKSTVLTGLEPNTEYTWKVVAYTKTYPDTVRSEPATFTTAGTGPSISKQPTEPTEAIQPGGSFTLSVEASGTPEPTYQWYKDGVSIPGATEATLSVTNASKDDAGDYYVVATNVAGEAKSTAASITVQEPVAITTDPEAQDVNAGENVTFTVEATGDGTLNYQWMKDGSPVSDQTSATCNLTAVTTNQAGTYTCVVSNGFSEKTSKGARLKVTPTYTLTYNKNGGNGNAPSPEKHPSGSNASIKNYNGLKKDGLTCIGWGDGTNLYKGGSTISMTKDITLYAVWQATVTFMNGNNQHATATAIEGNPVGNYPNNPSSSTATFKGWATSSNGSGSFDQSTKVSSDMKVYAKWEEITYTVKFIDNDCNNAPVTRKVKANQSVNCPTFSGTSCDKEFIGWTPDANICNKPIIGNATVYAQWKEVKKECIVTFQGELYTPSMYTQITVPWGQNTIPLPFKPSVEIVNRMIDPGHINGGCDVKHANGTNTVYQLTITDGSLPIKQNTMTVRVAIAGGDAP